MKLLYASCSAWSMPQSADANASEMPGNPPHDAVFVSKSRNGLPHCCASIVEFRYGCAKLLPASCVRYVGSIAIGSRGGLFGSGQTTAQLSEG